MKKYLICVFICVCFAAGGCSGRIGTLLEAARSQSAAETHLQAETKNFNSLKTAIEQGRLKSGLSQKYIKNNIGNPVVVQAEKYGERWVYKPAEGNFFDNNKINLYFDDKGHLIKYRVFEPADGI